MARKSAKELAQDRTAAKNRHRFKENLPKHIEMLEKCLAAGLERVRGKEGSYSTKNLLAAAKVKLARYEFESQGARQPVAA